jgi:hypothetical protein
MYSYASLYMVSLWEQVALVESDELVRVVFSHLLVGYPLDGRGEAHLEVSYSIDYLQCLHLNLIVHVAEAQRVFLL